MSPMKRASQKVRSLPATGGASLPHPTINASGMSLGASTHKSTNPKQTGGPSTIKGEAMVSLSPQDTEWHCQEGSNGVEGTRQHGPEFMTREQPRLGTVMLKISQHFLGNFGVQNPRQPCSTSLPVSDRSGTSTDTGSELGTGQFHQGGAART